MNSNRFCWDVGEIEIVCNSYTRSDDGAKRIPMGADCVVNEMAIDDRLVPEGSEQAGGRMIMLRVFWRLIMLRVFWRSIMGCCLQCGAHDWEHIRNGRTLPRPVCRQCGQRG